MLRRVAGEDVARFEAEVDVLVGGFVGEGTDLHGGWLTGADSLVLGAKYRHDRAKFFAGFAAERR